MQDLTALYIVDILRGFIGKQLSGAARVGVGAAIVVSNPNFEKLVRGARLAFVAVDRQGYRPIDTLVRQLRG